LGLGSEAGFLRQNSWRNFRVEAGIPGFKRVIIGETGHRMYVEKPEEFTRAVVTFLDATVVDFPRSK